MPSCCADYPAEGCTMHGSRAGMSALDRLGLVLSSLCLVHCVLLPVVIALTPALAFLLPPLPWLHPALLALAVPLSGLALWRGWRAHGLVRPAQLGTAGLVVLASALLFHADHPLADALLTVSGGLLIATGHILNWRALRRPLSAA